MIVWAAAAAGPTRGAAQSPMYRATWGWWAVAAGAGAFAALPEALHLPRGAPACAPCDPAGLPGIDRWVVGLDSRGAGTASDLLILGVAGGGLLASVSGLPGDRARGNAAMLVNTVSPLLRQDEVRFVAVAISGPTSCSRSVGTHWL